MKIKIITSFVSALLLASICMTGLSGCKTAETGDNDSVTTNGGEDNVPTKNNGDGNPDAGTLPTDAVYEAFKNPSHDLQTIPLFFWNVPLTEMSEEQVRELVRRSYEESGYDGLAILPNWMDGYMGEEYLKLYGAALDEGSKYGMHFILYDEDGYPSYTAGGLFCEKYPEYTARRLDMADGDGKAGDTIFVQIPDGDYIGAVAVNPSTGERYNISEFAHILEGSKFNINAQPVGAIASSTYTISGGYDVSKLFDGNKKTRWNSYQGSGGKQWVQINYGKTVSIDTVEVYEDADPTLHRTSAFEIQIWNGSDWENVASGTKIPDKGVVFNFDKALETQFIRLNLRRISGDSATISEFVVSYKGERLAIPELVEVEPEREPGYYASSIYSSDYDAAKAFDGNPSTRWNSQDGRANGEWIMAYYEKEVTIDSVYISEALGRIRKFTVEYLKDGEWTVCAEGTTIGTSKELNFDAVTANAIRLVVSTNTGDLPSIYEFTPRSDGEAVLPEKQQAVNDYDSSYIEYTIPKDASSGTWKVMVFTCLNEEKEGMDYLNPEAVAGFIEITHEAYYQNFKEYFDNGTIIGAFFDEPSFYPAGGRTAYGVEGARMWTLGLNDFFHTMYGDEDPLLLYPALWYDIGPDTNEARDKLYGVRSEMFAKNYVGLMNEWCEEHGIKLTGHMLFEEMVNPLSSEGDLMLCFKYQEIPGVDCIAYYGFSQEAYKIISSSAFNWDKKLVMSETFGAMGNGMPASTLFRQTIDLYTKGINYIIPHAIWYSDSKNVDNPPELSYRNSTYADVLPEYNLFAARLNSILQQDSIHVADIAMLYPIDYLESAYLFNGGQNNPSDANYMKIGEYLSLTVRRDFTYLHPEILDKCIVEDGNLVMPNGTNRESFKVFIVPGMKVISLSNLEKIYEFWKAGNPVIFVGTVPTAATRTEDNARLTEILTEMLGKKPSLVASDFEYEDGAGKTYHISSEKDLKGVLDSALEIWDVKLTTSSKFAGGYISYIHKIADGRNFYYVGNSSNSAVSLTVKLRGEFDSLELWNPADGSRSALETTVKNGVTTVKFSLESISSAFIVESAKDN